MDKGSKEGVKMTKSRIFHPMDQFSDGFIVECANDQTVQSVLSFATRVWLKPIGGSITVRTNTHRKGDDRLGAEIAEIASKCIAQTAKLRKQQIKEFHFSIVSALSFIWLMSIQEYFSRLLQYQRRGRIAV